VPGGPSPRGPDLPDRRPSGAGESVGGQAEGVANLAALHSRAKAEESRTVLPLTRPEGASDTLLAHQRHQGLFGPLRGSEPEAGRILEQE
jgi:hypothetical protein